MSDERTEEERLEDLREDREELARGMRGHAEAERLRRREGERTTAAHEPIRRERGYDSSNIYRPTQPELAEPIRRGEENPYPNSRVGSFIHRLGPHTGLLTLVGVRNLVIPTEMWEILTEGERLAAYISKGSLSWSPLNLQKFGMHYVGFPEFFMMNVYGDAKGRFPEGELESVDNIDHGTRDESLYRRLSDIPVIVRKGFKVSFLGRIDGFHEIYSQCAHLNRNERTREIYEAVTSSSQR